MATALAVQAETPVALSALVDRAVQVLAGARSAAEVLEATELAGRIYDEARRAARIAKAKQAHDDLIAATFRVQADALEIEAQAKRRLADEYDGAQSRGEVRTRADNQHVLDENKPRVHEIGLTRKMVHDARIVRDAEAISPGIVRRTVDDAVAGGKPPTRALVNRAVLEVVRPQSSPEPTLKRGKEAVRERVRGILVELSGLPPANEVADYFDGTDDAIIVSERFSGARDWLNSFAEAWEASQC